MSYLPRMSSTYKEPPEQPEEPEPETSATTMQPASSLLDEKTHNPMMELKQYKYVPHPPPALPGPSVADEATEDEIYREASKHRRSLTILESNVKFSQINLPPLGETKESLEEKKSKVSLPKPSSSKKTLKGSKTGVGKKKSKSNLSKKKGSSKDVTINMHLVGSNVPKSFSAAKRQDCEDLLSSDEVNSFRHEEATSLISDFIKKKNSEPPPKQVMHRSVQCTIFGSSEKVFVIPSTIKFLLRALAFLLHELNQEDVINCNTGESKRLMTQIQLILGDLCNQKTIKEFGFDVTYSDTKRVEKVLTDLRRYVKDLFGVKEESVGTIEDLKKVFIDLKKKEMELDVLKEKWKEVEEGQREEVDLEESYFKHPEITLQNKRLENEQLFAEKEFSSREMKKYQATLAEIDWVIKNFHEQLASLKKSSSTKSKTEILGRKASAQKLPSDILTKDSEKKL